VRSSTHRVEEFVPPGRPSCTHPARTVAPNRRALLHPTGEHCRHGPARLTKLWGS